jgi:hypothetical protein
METIEIALEPKLEEEPVVRLCVQTKNTFTRTQFLNVSLTTKQLIDLHDATGKLLARKFRGSKRDYDPEPEFGKQ